MRISWQWHFVWMHHIFHTRLRSVRSLQCDWTTGFVFHAFAHYIREGHEAEKGATPSVHRACLPIPRQAEPCMPGGLWACIAHWLNASKGFPIVIAIFCSSVRLCRRSPQLVAIGENYV
jgi:hypothetical protein